MTVGAAKCATGKGGKACATGKGWAGSCAWQIARSCTDALPVDIGMTPTDAAGFTGAFSYSGGCYYFDFTDPPVATAPGTTLVPADVTAKSSCALCPATCGCGTFVSSFTVSFAAGSWGWSPLNPCSPSVTSFLVNNPTISGGGSCRYKNSSAYCIDGQAMVVGVIEVGFNTASFPHAQWGITFVNGSAFVQYASAVNRGVCYPLGLYNLFSSHLASSPPATMMAA